MTAIATTTPATLPAFTEGERVNISAHARKEFVAATGAQLDATIAKGDPESQRLAAWVKAAREHNRMVAGKPPVGAVFAHWAEQREAKRAAKLATAKAAPAVTLVAPAKPVKSMTKAELLAYLSTIGVKA